MNNKACFSPPGRPENNFPAGSRGVALIMVLTSLLALSVVVLGVSEKTARQSRDMSLLLLEYRSSLLTGTGLELGLKFLENPADSFAAQEQEARIPTWQERGLTVSVVPCAAKLNLGYLGGSGPSGERMEKAVQEIFAGADLTAAEVNRLLNWIGAYGAEVPEDSRHTAYGFEVLEGLDYSAPGRKLSRPEELLLVPGFEGVEPEWIRRYFTVWGGQTGIDINFAEKNTVLALLPELEPYWDRLDSYRQNNVITHPNQLLTRIGLDIVTYNKVLPYIVLEPEYFEIIIEVREGTWYEKHRYIVLRNIINPGQKPLVLVRDILETRPL